jgi:hypothetical protein
MATYTFYNTHDFDLCVDGNMAYVTFSGQNADDFPATISGGTFTTKLTGWFEDTGHFSGSACTSGDVDVTGVLVADNTYQITITGSNLNCDNLTGGGYMTQSVNQVFQVILDGTSGCPATI